MLILYLLAGFAFVFPYMWRDRPCGWWWLALPIFVAIWPVAVIEWATS